MKLNSKRKGTAWELQVVKLLNERFPGHKFARAVQSGAYTGGKNASRMADLTQEQQLVFVGDIRVPTNFKFIIECKAYAKIDFWELFNEKSKINKFLGQVVGDANKVYKYPMLVLKVNSKPPIVFTTLFACNKPVFKYYNWGCCEFATLLEQPDSCFFEEGD